MQMENIKAQPEHEFLHRFVGNWENQPNEQMSTQERVTKLGENWIVIEGQMKRSDGAEWFYRCQLGYDRSKGKFVGVWIGTMMDHLWVYEGQLERNTLTLNCSGPSWDDPAQMVPYQDIWHLEDDNTRTLTSRLQKPDGSWEQFMQETYRKV